MRNLKLLALAIAAFSIQAQADDVIRMSSPITYDPQGDRDLPSPA